MTIRGAWFATVLITLTLILFTPLAQAGTTVIDTELGGHFTGAIDTAGVDFVQGRFMAAGGEQVTLTVQAVHGSTLIPTVTIRDTVGTPLVGSNGEPAESEYGRVLYFPDDFIRQN